VKRILLLLVIAAALAQGRGLDDPWSHGDHNGWGGAFYSNIARNYLRYGYLETRLAPVVSTGDLPREERRYYVTHPPFIGLSLSLSFRLFGEREWAARLVPLLFSLGSMLLLYRLGCRLHSKELGLVAAALFSFTPYGILYGAHVDPQGPPVTFFGLLLLIAYEERRPLVGAAALVLGAGFDWPIHYLAGLLALDAWYSRKQERRWSVGLLAGSFLTAASFLVYARVVAAHPSHQYLQASTAESFLFWSGIRVERDRIPGRPITFPTFGEWLKRMASHLDSLYTLPLLALAAFGAAATGFRGRVPPLWIPLLWGVIHILLFPLGAFVHDYWSMYLAPGLSLAAALGLLRVGQYFPRRRIGVVAASATAMCVFLLSAGIHRVDSLPRGPAMLGKTLHELTAPDEGVLLLNPLDARDAYYADRVVKDRINRIALFEEALKSEVRYRYFVVPTKVFHDHPQKPLFRRIAGYGRPYSLDDYYLFDLSLLPSEGSSRPAISRIAKFAASDTVLLGSRDAASSAGKALFASRPMAARAMAAQ
jgi:4-amino-4-deoxy-L-arabinose transferase-like glycosyltransferase